VAVPFLVSATSRKAPIGWEVVQLVGLQTLESDSLIDKPFGTLQIYEIAVASSCPSV
jgi:hypothetical protein